MLLCLFKAGNTQVENLGGNKLEQVLAFATWRKVLWADQFSGSAAFILKFDLKWQFKWAIVWSSNVHIHMIYRGKLVLAGWAPYFSFQKQSGAKVGWNTISLKLEIYPSYAWYCSVCRMANPGHHVLFTMILVCKLTPSCNNWERAPIPHKSLSTD